LQSRIARRRVAGEVAIWKTTDVQTRQLQKLKAQATSRHQAMKLAIFILDDMEAIIAEWEGSAHALVPASSSIGSLYLFDHAERILQAVAADLLSYQRQQRQQRQPRKFRWLAERPLSVSETATQTHAVLRARSGFDNKQLAVEYRALRATVLRLWEQTRPLTADTDLDDVDRFSAAIDQALAASFDSRLGAFELQPAWNRARTWCARQLINRGLQKR